MEAAAALGTPGDARALVFIGFMGAGKTSASRVVAQTLGVDAADADQVLERRFGTTIEAYFAAHGEAAFRAEEERLVLEWLEHPPAPVLALGGGAVTSPRVRAALERHTVVALDVDVETAWRRCSPKGDRPLARDYERFAALHAERAPLYEACADAVLRDSGHEVVRRAAGALRDLTRAPAQTKLLWAMTASGDYPVLVGEGLLGSGFWPLPGRRFLVSDAHVGELYAAALGDVAADVRVPPGEEAKTLGTAERVLRALAGAGMDHDDHVAALGGGVVGDLAGFCAALYQRGVPVVQVPTTLVAQVDSAYGGKTGVDLPEGKNYAGVYHQPAAVLADPTALATLPPAELAAGWAEVVKTALIAGGELWERVRTGTAGADRDTVLACARTKLAVVAADERDGGRRQILNLGHTVGHAIETATGYARYRHGEAVALGLLAALRLSGLPELRAEVTEMLAARGLPVTLDAAVDLDAVVAAVERDKKRRGGRVGFVLVQAPGDVQPGQPVADGDLRAAVTELRA
jgi:shikimate kinase/3-dehydroquinate synthase